MLSLCLGVGSFFFSSIFFLSLHCAVGLPWVWVCRGLGLPWVGFAMGMGLPWVGFAVPGFAVPGFVVGLLCLGSPGVCHGSWVCHGFGLAVGMGLPWVLGEHSEEREKRNEEREKK